MPDERRSPLGWLVNERVYVLAAERHRTSEGLTHGTTRGVAGPTVKYSAHACQQSGLQFWLPFEIVVPVGAASPPESRPTIVVPYKAHEPRRGRPMGQQSASPWKRRYQPWFIAAKPNLQAMVVGRSGRQSLSTAFRIKSRGIRRIRFATASMSDPPAIGWRACVSGTDAASVPRQSSSPSTQGGSPPPPLDGLGWPYR